MIGRGSALEIGVFALAALVVLILLIMMYYGKSGGGPNNGPANHTQLKPGLYSIKGSSEQWETYADAIEACFTASLGASVATPEEVAACKPPVNARPFGPGFVSTGRAVASARNPDLGGAALPEFVYMTVRTATKTTKKTIDLVRLQFSKATQAQDAYLAVPDHAAPGKSGNMILGPQSSSTVLYRVAQSASDIFSLVVAVGPMRGYVLYAPLLATSGATSSLRYAFAPSGIPLESKASVLFTLDTKGNLRSVVDKKPSKNAFFVNGTLPGTVFTPFAPFDSVPARSQVTEFLREIGD